MVEERRARGGVAPARMVGQGALLLLAAAMLGRAIYFVVITGGLIRWPFEAIGGEATMLHEAELLNRDLLSGLRTIYGPQAADRFVAGNYPPVYLLLWALKPGSVGYTTGRLLSLVSGFLAAGAGGFAIYRLLKGRGARWVRLGAAVLGGSAFFCTVPGFQQIIIAKPDMVALGFAALGLALFETVPGRRGTILAGVSFALGVLAKQSVGFALLAALIAAVRRGPRALITLVVTVGVIVLVVLGGLWLLAGPTLYERLITYNLRPWRQDRFDSLNGKFLRLTWPLIVPAVVYSLWAIRARAQSALTYYPLTALVVLLTVGSEGGARNYYIELCLAAGLGTALALGTLLTVKPALALPASVATLLVVGYFVFEAYFVFTRGNYVPEPPIRDADRLNRILAIVDAAPDPVLSDDVSYLAMRGRPVVIDDGFLCEVIREKGLWSNAAVVTAVQERRYSLVLTARQTTDAEIRRAWGDALVDALYANYDRTGPETFVPKR